VAAVKLFFFSTISTSVVITTHASARHLLLIDLLNNCGLECERASFFRRVFSNLSILSRTNDERQLAPVLLPPTFEAERFIGEVFGFRLNFATILCIFVGGRNGD